MSQLTEDWIIGFIWGYGHEEIIKQRNTACFSVQHHDQYLLQAIADYLNLTAPCTRKNKCFLRIPYSHNFAQKLFNLGWTGRQTENRQYPVGEVNQLNFIRGYSFGHCAYLQRTINVKKKYKSKQHRLVFRGAEKILMAIADFLFIELGISQKSLYQNTKNCYTLSYYSKQEIDKIKNLLEIPDEGVSKRKFNFIGYSKNFEKHLQQRNIKKYLKSKTDITESRIAYDLKITRKTIRKYKAKSDFKGNSSNFKKLTIEDMQALAALYNGKCLFSEYININTPVLWECDQGHQFEAKPSLIKYDHCWCPICKKESIFEASKKRRELIEERRTKKCN